MKPRLDVTGIQRERLLVPFTGAGLLAAAAKQVAKSRAEERVVRISVEQSAEVIFAHRGRLDERAVEQRAASREKALVAAVHPRAQRQSEQSDVVRDLPWPGTATVQATKILRKRVTLLRGISSALLIVENRTDIIRVPLSTPGAGQFQLLAHAGHFIERYPILDVLSL